MVLFALPASCVVATTECNDTGGVTVTYPEAPWLLFAVLAVLAAIAIIAAVRVRWRRQRQPRRGADLDKPANRRSN
ncbi:hypothetical protein AL755_04940 [Arthrobacter sp. ERGS1:01]|nr:hypothetical protein AL755_04940 [Arthrobacter sp. ERGS1:01]